ncbi:MAG: DUF805 domain-containing protein [Pseudomonadota bacterium]
MAPSPAFLKELSRTFEIHGRTSCQDYWRLAVTVLAFLLAIYVSVIGLAPPTKKTGLSMFFIPLDEPAWLFAFGVCAIPLASASIRRLHDAGRSALILFLPVLVVGLVPPVVSELFFAMNGPTANSFAAFGAVLFTTLYAVALALAFIAYKLSQPSQPGPNKYGPNPHEVTP